MDADLQVDAHDIPLLMAHIIHDVMVIPNIISAIDCLKGCAISSRLLNEAAVFELSNYRERLKLGRIFRGFSILLKYFFLTMLLFYGVQYLVCPIYHYPEPHPFEGEQWFNPYATSTENWFQANFQVQSRSWLGLTNGWDHTEEIYRFYKNLGYDIIGISDYQYINRFRGLNVDYVPVYEHGFNLGKKHQVLIGATEIEWNDFLFWQNRDHKQNILKKLKQSNPFVAIAHPRLMDAYSTRDMQTLTDYDAIEVLNHFRNSANLWDDALSAGHAVWIIGNDDSHDIHNPRETGVCWTMINASSAQCDDIIRALKNGKMYGVAGKNGYNDIRLKAVCVEKQRLIICCEGPVRIIRFIGQNGQVKTTVTNTKRAEYALQPDDTYIRSEIVSESCTLFLNPVFRSNGHLPLSKSVEIDQTRTMAFRLSIISFLGLGIILRHRKPIWAFKEKALVKNSLLFLKSRLASVFSRRSV